MRYFGASDLDKTWFWPAICAAVVVAVPVFLFSSAIQAMVGIVLIGLALLLVVAAFSCRNKPTNPTAKPWLPWAVALAGAVAALFIAREVNVAVIGDGPRLSTEYTAQAKLDVAAVMKDPTSVVYTEVKEAGITVCGMVNAKNSFGAYSGAERFTWTTVAGPEVESALKSTGFSQVDDMKRCMFDQEWRRCQGLPAGDVGECTRAVSDR